MPLSWAGSITGDAGIEPAAYVERSPEPKGKHRQKRRTPMRSTAHFPEETYSNDIEVYLL
jgi:hypothetical protein